tara:strand:+ start:1116 stop:1550 length:435 start_codon:yes stop_codon:yes gene_type:complete
MSKPVLSELEYNADDVASAILQKADLSITNENLGVTDISSEFTFASGWQLEAHETIAYAFNGFVFININCVHVGGSPSSGENIGSISDSDYHPITKTTMPSIGNQADSSYAIIFETDGDISQLSPVNEGSTNFHVVCNGFYRYA